MASTTTPDCHPQLPNFARRLCKVCYNHHQRKGTLGQFSRTSVLASEFVARYTEMRNAGLSRWEMAQQLGMDRHAIAQAYLRAVRRGELVADAEVA
jgi:hypothetical protein